MKNKRIAIALLTTAVACLALAGGVRAMSSSNFQLPWGVLSSGGGLRSSTNYILSDSTGQPAIGTSQSLSYQLEAGFLPGVTVSVPGVPQAGDANSDSKVDALDITKVERIIASLDAQTAGADANQDGNINAIDITKVERIIAGLD